MSELIINEMLNTLPFFPLGFLPMSDHLRYSLKRTIVAMLLWEFAYLCLFALLIQAGFPSVYVQYLALPVFLALTIHIIKADVWVTVFQFIFIIDYLLAIRAATFFLCQNNIHLDFHSWKSGVVTLLFTAATLWPMSTFLRGILKALMSVQILDFRMTAWLLPFVATTMILLLTGTIRGGTISSLALLSRILLLLSMFMLSHLMILFVKNLQEQIVTNERNKTMENLLRIQGEQYEMLRERIAETRRVRHDLRHHHAVILDMANRGDLDAIRDYLTEYSNAPSELGGKVYSTNPTVNAVLSYYAANAEAAGVRFTARVQLPDDKLIIPAPELCVLLGNLLENAVDACTRETKTSTLPSIPAIRVLIKQNGVSELSIAVDNSCSQQPIWDEHELVSTKHEGHGIGTASIRYIAKRYDGDARFEWRNGVFYASVMLNPQ